ncbi:MAG TPA: ABC transporter ATP-binding protein [Polyangiaceae bacterium]|nr:ABC transporter ATP-binding protein [Polyangiaceae bacterium]
MRAGGLTAVAGGRDGGDWAEAGAGLAVRCRGLVKRYAGVVAVDGLDLTVAKGECFGLLGPNGAGKTTTLEILEGMLEPTAGEVEILGRRWATDEAWLRERLGQSFQDTHLPARLTVRETVALFRSLYARGRDVDALVELVSLGEKADAYYDVLSGGQRQRLAVACALAGDPELLFLDEPTTGLDPQSRRMLWDVILAFKAAGGSVVLTTHYMDEAERLCDRIGVVDHGRMIALGTPPDLIASLGGSQIIELAFDPAGPPAAGLARALDGAPGVRDAHARGDSVALTVADLHVALPGVLDCLRARGAAMKGVTVHRATLEDVFVRLTGRALRE